MGCLAGILILIGFGLMSRITHYEGIMKPVFGYSGLACMALGALIMLFATSRKP